MNIIEEAETKGCVLTYVYPPIPDRSQDWQAHMIDCEEDGCQGNGSTKEAAAASWLDWFDNR